MSATWKCTAKAPSLIRASTTPTGIRSRLERSRGISETLWLLGAGLVVAALAALIGLIDVLGEPRIRALNDAWCHAGGNVIAVVIALYNWYLRYTSGDAAIVPLVLSLIVVCILLFTGWKGWDLVYRYRVGVADQ
jgi:uncharacterized membrane protein